MANAAEIADGVFDAWTARDFERERSLLHDDVSWRDRSTPSVVPTAIWRRYVS
jgi:ketosteroid isomerase-like protein